MKSFKEFQTELEEAIEVERIKHPVGQRPKGFGWTLKSAGEQTGKDHSVWERKVKKVGSPSVKEEVELSEDVKGSLQAIVDALIAAGNVTQTAHWNLRSSAFVAIHPWFGDTYDALFEMADAVAEQIKIADIDLMVNVNRGTTVPATDEQQLFALVQSSLETVKATLVAAGADSSLDRALQNLIDGWMSEITKMIWFIKASTK